MIRTWAGFIIFGVAMLLLSIFEATRLEERSCADHLLGVDYADGKCHTLGSGK